MSALKSVALNAFACKALENETWEGMCTWACECIQQTKTIDDMREEIRTVEQEMKAAYDVSAMPSAWRSAKSVVMTAVKHGLMLTDSTGATLGKTAVETAIKAHRLASKEPSTTVPADPAAIYMEKVAELVRMFCHLSPADKAKIPGRYHLTV